MNLINKQKVDVIFNALHGKDGEDGIAQSYFEYLRIPYTHSGVVSSYNAMNKIISKQIFIKNKILTPKFFTIFKSELKIKILRMFLRKKKIIFPIVIKPIIEGSSLGVKIVNNLEELNKSAKALLKLIMKLMFEEYIGGQEIQAAVINKTAIGAIELIPKRYFMIIKLNIQNLQNQTHNACKIK